MRRASTDESGFALVAVLILVAAIAALGTFGTRSAQIELQIARHDLLRTKALALAEAGISDALARMQPETEGFEDELSEGGTGGRLEPLGSIVTVDGTSYRFHPIGQGTDGYYVRLIDNYDERNDDDDPESDLDGRAIIVSRGNSSGSERIVEVGLQMRRGLFDSAVFGSAGLDLASRARTDSYDSSLGAYGASNVGENGGIGTNATNFGAVRLRDSAEVYGDAAVGPEGDPYLVIRVSDSAEVRGEQAPLLEEKSLPSAQAPIGPPPSGDIIQDHSSGPPVISPITSGVYSYGAIRILGNTDYRINASGSVELHVDTYRSADNAKVTIASNSDVVIVARTLEVDGQSDLRFRGSGNLRIYVTEQLFVGSNAKVMNQTQNPRQFGFWGTDSLTNVQFNSSSDFYGTIYAPQASMTYDDNNVIYGAIVGRSVVMTSNSVVHYDEALGRIGASCCAVTYWRDVRSF
jgi:hypothetical protein